MTYKTSLDTAAILITVAITILFAGIICGQYSIIKDAGRAVPIYTTTACVLIYFLGFVFRPITYITTDDELIIHRLLLNIHIKKSRIKSVELIDKKKIRGSIRIFGVGGLFGYYGKFVNFELGSMTWYATRRDRTVLIVTVDNKKIILTPNNPGSFVAGFNS
jgi:hypothetical protein